MRLFRVDTKGNKVEEIKTFEPLKGKYAAIQTAVEANRDGGKYLLDEGTGSYYEFDVKDGQPHFLPGNEGLHEGVPEKHLARIQRDPSSLNAKKERYGDFHLDSPGAAPEENPFNTPPPPTPEQIAAAEAEAAAAEAEAEEGREAIDISAETEAAEGEVEESPVEPGDETEETVEETPEDANVDNAEGESSEETDEAAPESTETVEDIENTEAEGAEETDEVETDEATDADATTDAPSGADAGAGGDAATE